MKEKQKSELLVFSSCEKCKNIKNILRKKIFLYYIKNMCENSIEPFALIEMNDTTISLEDSSTALSAPKIRIVWISTLRKQL